MFTLGLTEIFVIIIVTIIIIKPEDLPKFLRKIIKFYREVRKSFNDVNKIKDDFIHISETTDIKNKKPKI